MKSVHALAESLVDQKIRATEAEVWLKVAVEQLEKGSPGSCSRVAALIKAQMPRVFGEKEVRDGLR